MKRVWNEYETSMKQWIKRVWNEYETVNETSMKQKNCKLEYET